MYNQMKSRLHFFILTEPVIDGKEGVPQDIKIMLNSVHYFQKVPAKQEYVQSTYMPILAAGNNLRAGRDESDVRYPERHFKF